MRLEKYCDSVKKIYGENLSSIVLYGSAAADDWDKKFSDFNLLIVLKKLGLPELKLISGVTNIWIKSGNPPPLLFTMNRLMKSSDVFPLEMHDIRDSHKILFGSDPITDILMSTANLRLELEHELKGKLIQLRENYLLAAGNPKAVLELMVKSLSTFLVLFRGALRLLDSEIPACKIDALKMLADRLKFDIQIFETLDQVKRGKLKAKEVQPFTLFREYLKTIETVVDMVDELETEK